MENTGMNDDDYKSLNLVNLESLEDAAKDLAEPLPRILTTARRIIRCLQVRI